MSRNLFRVYRRKIGSDVWVPYGTPTSYMSACEDIEYHRLSGPGYEYTVRPWTRVQKQEVNKAAK
jgi:hypothetical protein